MTFCEARVQVGFPDYLLVDMGIFDLAAARVIFED